MPPRVPRKRPHRDAGQDLDVVVVQHQLSRLLDRDEVLGKVGRAGSLVRVRRVLPLLPSYEIMRARERGAHGAVLTLGGPASAMIEMQVRVGDRGDVAGSHSDRGQVLDQRLGVLDREDVAEFRIVLRADARVHEHAPPVSFDEDAVHGELDAVSLIGGRDTVPEHLGDDAEHGAAIQAEPAAGEVVDLVGSDFESLRGKDAGVPHKPSSVGFLRGDHFSGTSVAGRLKQPTRESSEAGHLSSPIWSFSEWGLPSRRRHRPRWCALTAPFHPCRVLSPAAVYFLWHFPWDRSRWGLPSTLPCGARTFLRPRKRGPRPPVALRTAVPACYAAIRVVGSG